jgi:hypothetical protein
VHFLETWTGLSALELARALLPAAFLLLAILVPGRAVARVAALCVAAAVPFLRELSTPAPVTVGWVGLWLWIAWQAGRPAGRPAGVRQGALESGVVGLLLGLAVLALLLAAVARQDLAAGAARRAAAGVLLISLGLLQLMVGRHARRAVVAFGAMGLGLEVLDGLARTVQTGPADSFPGLSLAGAGAAVLLATRLARGLEQVAGTAWVGDAHELHD